MQDYMLLTQASRGWAVAACSGDEVAGHVPRCTLTVCSLFIRRGGIGLEGSKINSTNPPYTITYMVVHGSISSWTVAFQFYIYNHQKKCIAGKALQLQVNPRKPRKLSTSNELHYTVHQKTRLYQYAVDSLFHDQLDKTCSFDGSFQSP